MLKNSLKFFLLYIWLLFPKFISAAGWTLFNGVDSEGKPLAPDPNNPGAATFASLEAVFQNILGLLIPFAGLAIFVMLIVAGFKYLTSGGDPKAMASASQTITWAVVGLLFLIGAWLVLLLIEEITGVKVTIFEVPKNTP